MTFVYPLLLSGLALIGIPILVHLIMRQKPKQLPFPAMRFLLQKHRTNQRKLQLRHLLLLALRIGLVGAICLALARPKVFSDRLNLSSDRPAAVAMVFDTSPSMGYESGNRSRLDEAKRRAYEVLDMLPEGSRVAVLDTAEPGGEWLASPSLARERIAKLELRPANNPVTTQLTPAYDLLAKLDQDAEAGDEAPARFLYVFSDRTQACWDPGQVENLRRLRDRIPAPGALSMFVDVGVESAADLAITNLEMARQVIAANERAILRATVRATGAPYDTEVLCTLDDQEPAERKPVKLEPGQSIVLSFERRGLPPGLHQAKVSLATADALSFNNARFATFEVRKARRVLTLTDDPRNAHIWRLALTTQDAFACEVKSPDDPSVRAATPADLADYQAICLLSVRRPSNDLWEKLFAYVGQGGGLAIIPGSNPDLTAYHSEPSRRLVSGTLVKVVAAPSDSGVTWSGETYQHPVMAPFHEWKTSGTIDFLKPGLHPAVFRYWDVQPDQKTVVVSYADKENRPALLEANFDRRSIRGRVLLFTTAFDDAHIQPGGPKGERWNDYLQTSFYFVLVQKTVGYLAGDAEERVFNYLSGQSVPVQLPTAPRSGTFTLDGPGITRAEGNIARPETQAQLQISQGVQPGNYQLKSPDGQAIASFSLNVPAEESQLAQVPKEQIEALFGADSVLPLDRKASLARTLESHWNQPIELLPWIMILVLLALAFENLLANKFYRTEKPEGGSEASKQRTE
jgi:hypothetical protein